MLEFTAGKGMLAPDPPPPPPMACQPSSHWHHMGEAEGASVDLVEVHGARQALPGG